MLKKIARGAMIMTLKEQLFSKLDEKKNRMLEIRRYLHAHPELSIHEEQTSKFI